MNTTRTLSVLLTTCWLISSSCALFAQQFEASASSFNEDEAMEAAHEALRQQVEAQVQFQAALSIILDEKNKRQQFDPDAASQLILKSPLKFIGVKEVWSTRFSGKDPYRLHVSVDLGNNKDAYLEGLLQLEEIIADSLQELADSTTIDNQETVLSELEVYLQAFKEYTNSALYAGVALDQLPDIPVSLAAVSKLHLSAASTADSLARAVKILTKNLLPAMVGTNKWYALDTSALGKATKFSQAFNDALVRELKSKGFNQTTKTDTAAYLVRPSYITLLQTNGDFKGLEMTLQLAGAGKAGNRTVRKVASATILSSALSGLSY